MSKLAVLKKQIAALEAQAERIAKAEMSSAIVKIKDIMSEFNLTIEHLSQAAAGKRAAKKTKAKTSSAAKYVDPKTGKTWSGVGRAPGWIAGAKDRDAFLAGKNAALDSAAKAPAGAKKVAKAVKVAKNRVAPAAKKATAAGKKTSAGKKISARKSAPKKVGSKRVAAAAIDPTATQAS